MPLNYTTAVNLIVDLGQSGSRIKIGDQVTNLLIAKTSSEAITFTVERIFREIKPQVFEKVFLSLTGLQGEVGNPQPYGELCQKFFQSQEVCVMDDGIASYVGALGEKDGVALTLGGGVVAIARLTADLAMQMVKVLSSVTLAAVFGLGKTQCKKRLPL